MLVVYALKHTQHPAIPLNAAAFATNTDANTNIAHILLCTNGHSHRRHVEPQEVLLGTIKKNLLSTVPPPIFFFNPSFYLNVPMSPAHCIAMLSIRIIFVY